jgi:hypothetical protein
VWGKVSSNCFNGVQRIASLKNLLTFHKGLPCEEKECRSFFDVYNKMVKRKKNYNPLRVKMLWVEAMQVVCIPCVACLDSFIIE